MINDLTPDEITQEQARLMKAYQEIYDKHPSAATINFDRLEEYIRSTDERLKKCSDIPASEFLE